MCINIENTIFKSFSTKTEKDVKYTFTPGKFYLKDFKRFLYAQSGILNILNAKPTNYVDLIQLKPQIDIRQNN